MAGDWIKYEKETSDKPEVFVIAGIVGIDPDAVIGKLLRVWGWFDSHTEDGNAPVTVEALLDRLTGVQGFVAAVVSAGWLKIEGGRLLIVNFERHNGETSKKRATNNKRVAKHRSRNGAGNADVTPSPLPGALPKALPEKIERRSNTPIVPLDSAMPWDSELFREAWATWKAYRRSKGKTLNELTEIQQLKDLKPLGEARAIAMIEFTISQGWTQMRESDDRATGGKPADSRRNPDIPRGESCYDIGRI